MPPPPPSAIPRPAEKIALGAGSLAAFFGYSGITSLAVPFYQMTLGVNPLLLGAAQAAPRLIEAFADPLMGNISDNWRSPWGRRRPFIVAGALAMGLLYGLIWMVPPEWSDHGKLAYFGAMSVFFYAAYTVFSVPYASLTYEMTPDFHERTRVMAHCSFFHKLGEFGYQWIFPASQLALFGSVISGVRVVGWVVGAVCLAGVGMLPALLVRERYADAPSRRPRVRFWSSLRQSLESRAFLVLLGLILVNIVMGMLASNVDHYVLVYYLFHGDVATGSIWKGVLSSAYGIVGIVAIPGVVWLSRRLGKRETLIAVYSLTIVGGVMKWFVFRPGHPWLILLDPLLCGPVWVAANVLLASMLADVCDEDEVRSGQRREGMYGSVFSWVQKTGASASFLGTGLALTLSGFKQSLGGSQMPGTLTMLRILLVASTTLPPLVALLLLRRYPLDAAAAAATQRTLSQRRSLAAV